MEVVFLNIIFFLFVETFFLVTHNTTNIYIYFEKNLHRQKINLIVLLTFQIFSFHCFLFTLLYCIRYHHYYHHNHYIHRPDQIFQSVVQILYTTTKIYNDLDSCQSIYNVKNKNQKLNK